MSPIMYGRETDYSDRELKSIENIARITDKFRDLKAQTNRPLYVDGTPIQGARFAKRMFFRNKQTEKEVFDDNVVLIAEKEQRKQIQTLRDKTEQAFAAKDYETMNEEARINFLKKIPTKEEYTAYNLNKARQKTQKEEEQFKAKQMEKYSFFPFTEGEGVEQRRAIEKINLNKELRESRQMAARTSHGAKRSKSKMASNSFNGHGGGSPFSNVRLEDLVSQKITPSNSSVHRDGQRDPPDSFNSSYPKFLEPHTFHPYRRLNDTHIEKVMNDAVKRVEQQVEVIKERRKKQSQEFDQKMRLVLREVEKDYFRRQKDTQNLHEYHAQQIRNKKGIFYINLVAKEAAEAVKRPENTYYGPEDKGYVNFSTEFKNTKNKREAESMLRSQQRRQMEQHRRAVSFQNHKERLKDVENLWVAGKVMAKENNNKVHKQKMAKQAYKELWKEQMKINKKRDIIRQEGGEKITS